MASEPLSILVPTNPEARKRGYICPEQECPGPPWIVDGDCPLHGYRARPEDRALPD